MPVDKRRSLKGARGSSEKVVRSYRLAPARIAAARRALGAATDTAAIEMALDMAVFAQEMRRGVKTLRKLRIEPIE